MALTHVVLDFDGTCTLVAEKQADFLASFKADLIKGTTDGQGKPVGADFAADWDTGYAAVLGASPDAGWTTLSKCPSAPIAADPYIAAGEIVAWLERRWQGGEVRVPKTLFADNYKLHAAPFRPELREVLQALVELELTVAFVSNSATHAISAHLDHFLGKDSELRQRIAVYGDAAKYVVRELDWDRPFAKGATKPFRKLPATQPTRGLDRPLYLRRGAYYQALLAVWGEAGPSPRSTMVVGDIYELDLAMPAALGAHVHLIERAAPFATCDYERALVRKAGGKVSADLTKLPSRAKKLLR